MPEPLVSIIIPCYNGEKYVSDAINSALAQTYTNIEVIVIDDGSIDDSVQVVRAYGDQITLLPGKNYGACPARNKGIRHAKGKYIQFLDADDLLEPTKVESQIRAIDTNSPNCISFSTGKSIQMEDGTVVSEFKWPDVNQGRNVILEHLPTPGPLHLRKVLHDVGGFDESLSCCQEKDLHLRLLNHGIQFIEIDNSGYIARRVHGSVSAYLPRVYATLARVLWQAYSESRDTSLKPYFSAAIARNAGLLWKTRQRSAALAAMRKANEIGGWNSQHNASRLQRMVSLMSQFRRYEQLGIERKLMVESNYLANAS